MRMIKSIATAIVLSVGALSFTGIAEAGDRRGHYGVPYWKYKHSGKHFHKKRYSRYHHRKRHYHRHRRDNDFFPGFAFGLATGAIVSGAFAQPRVYYDRCPSPWSRSWYAYCDAKYVSFNPRTGRFKGYDGRWHTCSC